MVRTIVQRNLHVNNRESCQNAGLHRALNTLIDRTNVFLGNRAADNGIDEFVAFAAFVWLNFDLNVTVLTFTA